MLETEAGKSVFAPANVERLKVGLHSNYGELELAPAQVKLEMYDATPRSSPHNALSYNS